MLLMLLWWQLARVQPQGLARKAHSHWQTHRQGPIQEQKQGHACSSSSSSSSRLWRHCGLWLCVLLLVLVVILVALRVLVVSGAVAVGGDKVEATGSAPDAALEGSSTADNPAAKRQRQD
jgi:hypothetical protein